MADAILAGACNLILKNIFNFFVVCNLIIDFLDFGHLNVAETPICLLLNYHRENIFASFLLLKLFKCPLKPFSKIPSEYITLCFYKPHAA